MGYFNEFFETTFDVLIVVCLCILIVSLLVNIIGLIGEYAMFRKAKQSGWLAFIPIYNDYILCTITGVNPWWVLFNILAALIGGLIPIIGVFLAVCVPIYFRSFLAVSTARSYGKEDVWAVGIFFLKPIFYLALGFGSSEYLGEKAPNDVVLEALGIDNKKDTVTEANVVQEKTVTPKFCPNCGSKIEFKESKYCTSCGKAL